MIIIDSTICTDFVAASSREWLETNGIGGFASGTISGANTRRYHGLFTPATEPPLGRIRMLSKLEEILIVGDAAYELSANQYPNKIHPQGFQYLRSFRLDPFPVWLFEVDGLEVEKKIFMVHGRNTTVCQWQIRKLRKRDPRPVSIEVRPLISFVDYHHLQHVEPTLVAGYETNDGEIEMRPFEDVPPMFFRHNATRVEKTGHWYRDFEYAIERERGFDFREDLFQPFTMTFDAGSVASITISTEQSNDVGPAKLEKGEIRRRLALLTRSEAKDDLAKHLVLAADQFVVARGSGHTIIAGYPWFSDWGRDTMIALHGSTLAANRPDIAREILLEYSNHISDGMLPNRFPDAGGEAEYNTVDATLWYFEAVRAYVAHTRDRAFVRDHLYTKLVDIIASHLRGTRYRIHVDTDGLLYAGEPGAQLTWMDAKIGDVVITPRIGKAVEVQALWYNALCIMADLAETFADTEDLARYRAMAHLTKLSFNGVFWNEDDQCLYDVVDNGFRDDSIRPNQIFAVSLPYSMLDPERSKKVVDRVETDLLTPVGLRSLSPKDKRYVPVYIGSPFERDSGYHQGTVWAWLIGPFVDAFRKVYPDDQGRAAELLAGFRLHLKEAGIGQISEIFDGEPPHTPRGCPAQAWSVAEVLRTLVDGD